MTTTADELREEVRRRYAESARAVTEGTGTASCGGGSCCVDAGTDAAMFGEALYDAEQRGELPEAATLASLGCGNPTAVAELREGETVLDLGSGGGIDVLLSAKRVGPTGTAYGLDMTDEMLALARAEVSAELEIAPELAFPGRVTRRMRSLVGESGERAIILAQEPLLSRRVSFPLVRARPAIQPGSYRCSLRYEQPDGPTLAWRGTREMWDRLGVWTGSIQALPITLEVLPGEEWPEDERSDRGPEERAEEDVGDRPGLAVLGVHVRGSRSGE